MSRPSTPAPAPDSAPEIVAEIRRLRQLVIVRIANAETDSAHFRQMDAGLRRALANLGYAEPDDAPREPGQADVRMVQGLDDVRGQVEHLVAEVARLGALVDARPLISEGFVVQANEVLRNLRSDIHDSPALTANACALALGGLLREVGLLPVPEAEARPVEVGEGGPRRRKAEAA